MVNPDRELDKTHLSIDQAEERGFIHRDYIAHCLRWSHVCKYMSIKNKYKTARILEVGCGKEIPLLKTLYTSRMSPAHYTGYDLNIVNPPILPKIINKMGADNIHIHDETDFSLEAVPLEVVPTVIVCFEVLEHVSPSKCLDILATFYTIMAEDTIAFISTPCYNGKAAANHINEMTYQAFGSVLEAQGFEIIDHWGTFASQSDLKKDILIMDHEQWSLFDLLKEYYDSNFLATVFAPLFPEASRNVLWKVKKRQINCPCPPDRKFSDITECAEPWSSSKDWN